MVLGLLGVSGPGTGSTVDAQPWYRGCVGCPAPVLPHPGSCGLPGPGTGSAEGGAGSVQPWRCPHRALHVPPQITSTASGGRAERGRAVWPSPSSPRRTPRCSTTSNRRSWRAPCPPAPPSWPTTPMPSTSLAPSSPKSGGRRPSSPEALLALPRHLSRDNRTSKAARTALAVLFPAPCATRTAHKQRLGLGLSQNIPRVLPVPLPTFPMERRSCWRLFGGQFLPAAGAGLDFGLSWELSAPHPLGFLGFFCS